MLVHIAWMLSVVLLYLYLSRYTYFLGYLLYTVCYNYTVVVLQNLIPIRKFGEMIIVINVLLFLIYIINNQKYEEEDNNETI